MHAVCLPHVALGSKDLGPARPRARVLDAQALQAVEGAVLGALRSADRSRPDLPPLGKDGVEQVVDALAVRRTLTLSTPTIASEVRTKLATLTDEQFDILRTLGQVPRVQITGGPGTGKTVLAIEAARRLAAQGLDTLLLCFNAPLGGFLTKATAGTEGLTATHFHAFCRRMATEAGLGAQLHAAENNDGYRHVFPELLLEASESLNRTFDALVVDEAQDFTETWWAALEGCLKEGSKAPLYLFEDELQALDERHSAERPSGLVGPLPLTKDCRNTDEIHAFLAACPGGPADLRPSGVSSGILPRITWIEDEGKLPRQVSATVARLIHDWNVPASEIVVLTPRAPGKSALGKLDRLGPARASWRERESDQHVLIDTIHRFKGLEATAVVLAEVTADIRPDLETCLRVGCSRPTVHLDVLASSEIRRGAPVRRGPCGGERLRTAALFGRNGPPTTGPQWRFDSWIGRLVSSHAFTTAWTVREPHR